MNIFNNLKYDENSGKVTINLKFPVDYTQQAKLFFDIYQQESCIIFSGKSTKKLKAKKDRICRFCGKSIPDVKFTTDAHFIPEFLGNKNYFSDFECDSCNHRFGLLENEFACFLGLSRTLSMHRVKNRIPTFKSPDKNLTIRAKENDLLDFEEKKPNLNIKVDKETMTIRSGSHPHCLISVFKSLAKIGLSMLPEESIHNYVDTIKYLFEDNAKKHDNSLIAMIQHIIPGPSNKYPVAFSYIKKTKIKNELIPKRTFVILFHNRMIQFFLPFNNKETLLNRPKAKPKVANLPPIIDQDWYTKYGQPQMQTFDLNIYGKIRNENEKIKLRIFRKDK